MNQSYVLVESGQTNLGELRDASFQANDDLAKASDSHRPFCADSFGLLGSVSSVAIVRVMQLTEYRDINGKTLSNA